MRDGGYWKALLRLGAFKYDRCMSENENMISDGAVEAAAKAVYGPDFDFRMQDGHVLYEGLETLRAALEAAAPYIIRGAQAEAWDEGVSYALPGTPKGLKAFSEMRTSNPYRSQA